jgi:hypothetical protein
MRIGESPVMPKLPKIAEIENLITFGDMDYSFVGEFFNFGIVWQFWHFWQFSMFFNRVVKFSISGCYHEQGESATHPPAGAGY